MDTNVTPAQRQELAQHWVALRANLLSWQERLNGQRFSWVSHVDRQCGRYMSTEGTATVLLALRVDEEHSSDADQYVFAAVTEGAQSSTPSFMTYGPYWHYPPGSYTVDFFLRAPAPTGTMATVEVYDANASQFLAQQNVQATDLAGNNDWSRISLPITVTTANNRLEFRVYWQGTANLDVAAIRVW